MWMHNLHMVEISMDPSLILFWGEKKLFISSTILVMTALSLLHPGDPLTLRSFPVFHSHSTKLNTGLRSFSSHGLFSLLISQECNEWAEEHEHFWFFILIVQWPFKGVLLTEALTTSSFVNVLLGHRGDEPHPTGTGVHMHVPRRHQCEGQGGAENVLCKHRNVTIPFPEQFGILKNRRRFG